MLKSSVSEILASEFSDIYDVGLAWLHQCKFVKEQPVILEQWLIDAKEKARIMADEFVDDIRLAATDTDLDPDWFLEEVVKNIHIVK